MNRKKIPFRSDFKVLFGNRRGQAAEMVLKPGDKEGGPDNRHDKSDQWMYIVSGTGLAIVNGKRNSLNEHTLLLIERGETHEIQNKGEEPLRTLNFYVPPAY